MQRFSFVAPSWLAAALAALLMAGCASLAPTAAPEASSTVTRGDSPAPPARQPYSVETPADFERAVEEGTRTMSGEPGPDYWQNTAAYTLEARLLPSEKRLEARARIRYRNNSPDTLQTLHLELAQNLHKEGAVRKELNTETTGGVQLDRVALGGEALASVASGRQSRPAYQVLGTQLILAPSEPVLPGAMAEIEVDYAFTVPQQGASGRMGYSPAEADPNLFYIAYWYPIMSVYDDVEGWATDQFQGNAEFYSGFANYDVTIEVPAGWLVQSTGVLQNPEDVLVSSALQRMRRAYRSDEPIIVVEAEGDATRRGVERLRYRFTAERVRDVAFSAMQAGAWNWEAARAPIGDRDGDGQADYTQINTYWRDAAPRWAEVTRYQQDAITAHSEHTDLPYPYPHMSAVEGSGIIGGGMEFPMMTIMGDYNARSDTALYNVTSHELAHMWIPMQLSTNERRRSWIDEGTTTFNEDESRLAFYPDAPNAHVESQESYLGAARAGVEAPIMRWSDYHYSGAAFGVASYPKPAAMLVALRGLLGDDAFYDAYTAFMQDWQYKHPYPQDFFNAFERAAGGELDWFWDALYYETYTMDQALAAVETGRRAARITVRNLGRAPMPVDLTLTLEDGSQVTRRVPVATWLAGRTETTVAVETPAPVERVEIDAARNFPDIDRANNVWTRSGGLEGGTGGSDVSE